MWHEGFSRSSDQREGDAFAAQDQDIDATSGFFCHRAMMSLDMATIVATQHNRLIKAHYRQLIGRGKAKMTALVACMRKLLLILNAMIKNQSPWKGATAS